ncbi:MAG: TniB family NTP-binding protein [Pseudorhodobacter sp.]|nr:TniB family NTP-binding protein [Frankiaceae bacterium]
MTSSPGTTDNAALCMSLPADWPKILRMRTAEPPTGGDAAAWGGWLSDRYIPTHNGKLFREQVERTASTCRGIRRRWVGVDAPAGFGKTEVVSQWAMRLPPVEPVNSDFDPVHIIWIEVDGKMQGAGLFASILRFLGFDVPTSSTESALRDQLIGLLPRLGTRYLVIDDAHMLRLGKSRLMADTCRSILRLPVTSIFVGTDFDNSALLGKAVGTGAQASDQMRRRHDKALLTPLMPGDPMQERAFTDLVADFRRLYLMSPGSSAPVLGDSRLVGDLHLACGGHAGPLFECLKRAAAAALLDDGMLTAAHIQAYWPDLQVAA